MGIATSTLGSRSSVFPDGALMKSGDDVTKSREMLHLCGKDRDKVAAAVRHYSTGFPELLDQLLSSAKKVGFSSNKRHNKRHNNTQGFVWELVNEPADKGQTPLMVAANHGCVASCKLLLEHGANPWAVDRIGGRTALHYAVCHNNPELVQLLLVAAGEHGPVQYPNRRDTRFVNVRTYTGCAAIHCAVQAKAHLALGVLLNYGANITVASMYDSVDWIVCPSGATALHLAASAGDETAARQLLRAYVERRGRNAMCDPRVVLDQDAQMPYNIAQSKHHREMAQLLHPQTPLMAADGCCVGPSSLSVLAANALRGHLQQQLTAVVEELGADDNLVECDHGDNTDGGAADCPETPGAKNEDRCGVCLDAMSTVLLAPCKHTLCTGCCAALLDQQHTMVLQCPFCRGHVSGLTVAAAPASSHE